MTLGLLERLKNSDLNLESKMGELNQNKSHNNRLTRFCVKTFFYLVNESHTIQLFTRILQNGGFSKKLMRKAPN